MAKRPKTKDGQVESELAAIQLLIGEMQSVKNLLMLQALAAGCQQKHIAAVLGVSDATLSRMFPKGFARDMAKVAGRSTGTVEGS